MGIRQERELLVIQWKSQPCYDCEGIFPTYCMDFDHVPERGEKLFEVNLNSGARKPLEDVLLEMKKCDLVCVLCHRIRTHDRKYPGVGAKHKIECTNGHDLTNSKNWLIVEGRRKGCLECKRVRTNARYHGESYLPFVKQEKLYRKRVRDCHE